MAIVSYKDQGTRDVASGKHTKASRAKLPSELHKNARLKMAALDLITQLSDLGQSTELHLEKLSGSRAGQWSLRINSQYRICFVWSDGDVENVEVVDYH